MSLAEPTYEEIIGAVRGLDADDEMTEVIVAGLEKLRDLTRGPFLPGTELTSEEVAALPKRPLVIVYVGGGLVQDFTAKEGEGEPRVYVIDWDREGQGGYELEEFADQIEEARDALSEYFGTVDEITMLTNEAAKYRRIAESDETASRYR